MEDHERHNPPSIAPIIAQIQQQIIDSDNARTVRVGDNTRRYITSEDFLTLIRRANRIYGFTRDKRKKWFLYGIAKSFTKTVEQGKTFSITRRQEEFLCVLARTALTADPAND
jgi:hypothetical protein